MTQGLAYDVCFGRLPVTIHELVTNSDLAGFRCDKHRTCVRHCTLSLWQAIIHWQASIHDDSDSRLLHFATIGCRHLLGLGDSCLTWVHHSDLIGWRMRFGCKSVNTCPRPGIWRACLKKFMYSLVGSRGGGQGWTGDLPSFVCVKKNRELFLNPGPYGDFLRYPISSGRWTLK